MTKIEKEYKEKYGDIPNSISGRVDYLLATNNLSRQKEFVYDKIKRINSIKWIPISYTIFLIPKATPRPRSGKGGIFYVKGAKDNKKIFEEFAKSYDGPIITTPTKFYCNAYFPIPSSMNIVEKICAELGFIRPISKPDWDNIAKSYCDMIQGTILYDDSTIVEGTLKKYYSVKPRIEIDIKYMESFDSKFNESKLLNRKV